MYEQITLDSGLRLMMVPQKEGTEALTILVLVKTGSKYETKEVSGISHFVEHMLFKGTAKRPTYLEVAEALDNVGGVFNAFTSREYTGYFAKVGVRQFDLALDWISDIFLNSLMPAREIRKEKGVIIEEINMYLDNPMDEVSGLWFKCLYGDQPAGWEITGSKESVGAVNRQKLLKYFQDHYTAKNTIVCVAGKLDRNSVKKKIEKAFAKTRKKEAPLSLKTKEEQTKPVCLLKYRKTDQTHLCLGVRAFNLFHSQRFSQSLAASLLGGMMSSRLFVAVREKMGLAYYVSCYSSADPDTGFIVTRAGVKNEQAEKAIRAILKECRRLTKEKIGPAELKKTKENFKGRLALGLESSDAQALFYGLQALLEKKILTPGQIFNKIDEVSDKDVLDLAKEIFIPSKLNLALVGPFKNKNRLQKLLKI